MPPREKKYYTKPKKLLLGICKHHKLDCENLTKLEISQKLAERDEKLNEMKIYYRNIDACHRQYLLVSHDEIVSQWFESNIGQYIDSGNPEWIGKKITEIKSKRFKLFCIPKNQDIHKYLPVLVREKLD